MTYRNRSHGKARRGVLLLVVLSLLVMFLLAGMTFIVVAGSFKKDTALLSRHEQVGDPVENILDVALNDILRGPAPQNTSSVLSGPHSLLDDLYGRDGFVAQVMPFPNGYPYAVELGTGGQVKEVYFRLVRYLDAVELPNGEYQPGPNGDLLRAPVAAAADPQPLIRVNGTPNPDTRFIMSYRRPFGVVPVLPVDEMRFNGCPVTVLNDVGDGVTTRVMSISRHDSFIYLADNSVLPLTPGHLGTNAGIMRILSPEGGLTVNVGDRLVVNGRTFNGTGNGFAASTQNVDRQLSMAFTAGGGGHDLQLPIALLPNEAALRQTVKDLRTAAADGVITPIRDLNGDTVTTPLDVVGYQAAGTNDDEANAFTSNDIPLSSHSQADESWDAPDFQNMHLAAVPWIQEPGKLPYELHPILASFHRPDLANYWFNELIKPGQPLSGLPDKKTAIYAFEYPYGQDRILGTTDDGYNGNTLTPDERQVVVSIRRMISMRPLPEDHPGFERNNPRFHSILSGLATIGASNPSSSLLAEWGMTPAEAISYINPAYDVSGTIMFSLPLDVDNDGDNVADSIWMDFGFPASRAKDGRLYKPLIAPLCIDLDARVNVNAADRLRNPNPWHLENPYTPTVVESDAPTTYPNLNTTTARATPGSLGEFILGSGIGPAEIGLSSDNAALNGLAVGDVVNGLGDDFMVAHGDTAFVFDDPAGPPLHTVARIWMASRYSSSHNINGAIFRELGFNAAAGIDSASPPFDTARSNWLSTYYNPLKLQQAAHFPTISTTVKLRPSDYHGHTSVLLDHNGQPLYVNSSRRDEFERLPYEANLVRDSRFDSRFTEEDLEGILRSWDPSAPESRLITSLSKPTAALTPELRRLQLDMLAHRLRSMVTTRSFEVPSLPTLRPDDYNFKVEYVDSDLSDITPVNSRIRRRVLKDGLGNPLYTYRSSTAAQDGAEMRELTTIADLFRARLLSVDADHGGLPWPPATPVPVFGGNDYLEFEYDMAMMLPYEIARGQRFDLNRPFGDGLDNDGGGYYDETDVLTWSMTWGNVTVLGETDDPCFFPVNVVNGHPQLVSLADSTADGFQRVIPTFYPLRQTFARHLYCLMMFMMPADYEPDMDGDGGFDLDDRRLLARAVAQYAINVVDARDPDSAMTPFEFDVNPYNGWDVIYDMVDVPGDEEEIVWGMEKPEVLITETLAHHDLRTEDLSVGGELLPAGGGPPTDDDMDQRLLPQSSFFAELYNCGDLPVDLGQLAPDGAPVYRMMVSLAAPAGTPNPDPDHPDPAKAMDEQYVDRFIYFSEPPPANTDLHKVRPTSVTESPKPYFYRSNGIDLAPLLPARYAVLGSGRDDGGSFETYFGRTKVANEAANITTFYNTMRRIVLTPDTDPDTNQVSDGSNTNAFAVPLADRQPAIAVVVDRSHDPVGGADEPRPLSISDPKGGYDTRPANGFVSTAVNGEGAFTPPKDEPLDWTRVPTVLIDGLTVEKWKALRDVGTTNAFRVVYLQRLADPLRPWDSRSNPYRTVDRSTTDLTVMNGLMDQSAYAAAVAAMEPPVNFSTVQRGDAETVIVGAARSLWRVEPRRPPGTPLVADDPSHYFPHNLRHTLGYLNRRYGETASILHAATGGGEDVPTYLGAPLADAARPTFPWLTWNNRPYSSPAELMLVPFSRSSTLGDDYAHGGMTNASNGVPSEDEYKSPANASALKIPLRSATFGHLLDFFGTETDGASFQKKESPHLYRLLDYVEVRSPFVGTELAVDRRAFGDFSSPGTNGYRMPLNYVSRFRNPGKVNVNTIRDPHVWNSVNASYPYKTLWGNLTIGRMGTPIANPFDFFDGQYPTMFANPFRAASSATLMPNSDLPAASIERSLSKDKRPVDATLLRAATAHASAMPTDVPFYRFSSSRPSDDSTRNAAFRYQAYQRMQNLTTNQSNVYAIWLTVGYFEVSPETGELGQEMGLDTGDVKRHRGFYVIDRSVPVAFEPGKNHNVDKTVVLRRIIE